VVRQADDLISIRQLRKGGDFDAGDDDEEVSSDITK
jgi:hypothetical protein